MNELIKQIWDKAAMLEPDSSWEGQTRFMEKFAELIVRECVDICIEHPSRIASNNWHPTMVSADIAYRLEEHFGVEE
mgnify:CR=1 FL=1